jgi:hypothetical protein
LRISAASLLPPSPPRVPNLTWTWMILTGILMRILPTARPLQRRRMRSCLRLDVMAILSVALMPHSCWCVCGCVGQWVCWCRCGCGCGCVGHPACWSSCGYVCVCARMGWSSLNLTLSCARSFSLPVYVCKHLTLLLSLSLPPLPPREFFRADIRFCACACVCARACAPVFVCGGGWVFARLQYTGVSDEAAKTEVQP